MPGVEASKLFGPQWRLAAFAELGVANVPTDSSANLIYAAGGRARYEFLLGDYHMRYACELLYAGSQVDQHADDTMVRVTNGIDALRRTRMSMRGEVVDYGPYAMNEWFPKRPNAPVGLAGPADERAAMGSRHDDRHGADRPTSGTCRCPGSDWAIASAATCPWSAWCSARRFSLACGATGLYCRPPAVDNALHRQGVHP